MIDLIAQLKKNPFVLAPMAGITDLSFRDFMKEQGASVVITELVSAKGLQFESEKTQRLMAFSEKQRPVGVQLFGESPESIAEAAKMVQDEGADFVDLNFGCPVKKVVKKGAGSAVLKDMVQLRDILRTVKSAIEIPLTIKIRTGWDENSRNADQVCRVAYDEGITWVAIHGRTRAAAYSGQADWEYIREVKAESPLPVLGNGDLTSADKAVSAMKESGCDGVMIGRGCLKNPFIFLECNELWQKENTELPNFDSQYQRAINGLYELYCRDQDERIVQIQLKKFCSWFSSGFPGSAEFRKSVYQCKTTDDILDRSNDFFSKLVLHSKADTSKEAFLMGGHG